MVIKIIFILIFFKLYFYGLLIITYAIILLRENGDFIM